MREILDKKFNLKKNHLYLVVFFVFIIIAFYHIRSGYHMSSDSYRFSRWADKLIELNFNFFDFYSIEKAGHRPHLFFFTIPVLSIALCKYFFVNEWQSVFLIINLSLLLIFLIIFVNSLLLVRVKPILIFLSFPLIIVSADVLTWPRYILSDMIYAFLVMLSVYFVTKSIVKNKISFPELLLIIFLLLASRPSSIPVVFAIIFFVLISNFQIFLNFKNILFFLLILFFFTPFIFAFLNSIINTYFSEIPNLKHLIEMVKVGMIIHDRPDTWINNQNNFFDVVYLYFLRSINFFNPYASTFSRFHLVVNFLQFFTILFSIFISLFSISHKKIQIKIMLFILILSLFVAEFHSFTLIDYDWRFRFPVILPLLMLFPLSLSMFLYKDKS